MKFKSNGKLLLTGEYLVLDGAKSLALPTTFGQSLTVEKTSTGKLLWKSFSNDNKCWYTNEFDISAIRTNTSKYKDAISSRLLQLLNAINTLNPTLFNTKDGYCFSTHLDFNRNWGLGSSSTLINNLANWANVNPYKLLELTFGGSGYDVACAQNNTAITYQLIKNDRSVTPVEFNPSFKDNLYFIYLNKKQNSRDAIKNYRTNKVDISTKILEINAITDAMLQCQNLDNFEALIKQHETLIASIIKVKPIQEELFPDYKGTIKSLGAWGGDFVMATSNEPPEAYFKSKGYHTVLEYKHMIKA